MDPRKDRKVNVAVIGGTGSIGAHVVADLARAATARRRQRPHARGAGSRRRHGKPLVALLGHTGYYPRFGFRPADQLGITPPVTAWASHFQVWTLSSYRPQLRGSFRYPQPFTDL